MIDILIRGYKTDKSFKVIPFLCFDYNIEKTVNIGWLFWMISFNFKYRNI